LTVMSAATAGAEMTRAAMPARISRFITALCPDSPLFITPNMERAVAAVPHRPDQ
jgi:hypothetical protein